MALRLALHERRAHDDGGTGPAGRSAGAAGLAARHPGARISEGQRRLHGRVDATRLVREVHPDDATDSSQRDLSGDHR